MRPPLLPRLTKPKLFEMFNVSHLLVSPCSPLVYYILNYILDKSYNREGLRKGMYLYRVIQNEWEIVHAFFLRAALHSWSSNRWQNCTDAWTFWKYAYISAILILTIQTVTEGKLGKTWKIVTIHWKTTNFYSQNRFCSHFHNFYSFGP